MSVVKELIRTEDNGKISFGNYELTVKSKLSDFEFDGDMYKVKTYNEITKQNRLSVAAVEGPASIYLEGGVRYYSEGAVLEGDRIQTPEEGICYLVFQ